MKLQTSIKPRRDGVVRATGPDGLVFVFAPNADGVLECDVTDPATLAALLATQLYWPADPAHAELAAKIAVPLVAAADDDEDDGDEDANSNALPVEANTPPARFKPGRSPRRAG